MLSSAARAKWAAVVPRVMPVIVPRAYWSQCVNALCPILHSLYQ
jgi:hypothetical protein